MQCHKPVTIFKNKNKLITQKQTKIKKKKKKQVLVKIHTVKQILEMQATNNLWLHTKPSKLKTDNNLIT